MILPKFHQLRTFLWTTRFLGVAFLVHSVRTLSSGAVRPFLVQSPTKKRGRKKCRKCSDVVSRRNLRALTSKHTGSWRVHFNGRCAETSCPQCKNFPRPPPPGFEVKMCGDMVTPFGCTILPTPSVKDPGVQ